MKKLLLASCALFLYSNLAYAQTINSSSSTTATAYSLLNSEGVTTQIVQGAHWQNTYWKTPDVLADLNYLNIHQLRDSDIDNYPATTTEFENIGCPTSGPKNYFVMLIASGGNYATADLTNGTYPLTERISTINTINSKCPDSVEAVEGANEVNNYPIQFTATVANPTYGIVAGTDYGATCGTSSTWNVSNCNKQDEQNAALAVQLALAQAFPGYGNTGFSDNNTGPQTIYFTGWSSTTIDPNPFIDAGFMIAQNGYAPLPVLTISDNQHPYPQNGSPPLSWMHKSGAYANQKGGNVYYGPGDTGANVQITPFNEAAVATEEGYPIGTSYLCDYNYDSNVTADIAGKQQLDYWLDGSQQGLTTQFVYKLINTDSSGFGLFDATNTATLEAQYIHYFNAILTQQGTLTPVYTNISAPWSLTGGDKNTYAETYVYSATQYFVIVWHEVQLCTNQLQPNSGTVKTITPLPINLTVNDSNGSTITEFDPTTLSTNSVKSSTTGSISENLVDHPIMFFVNSN